MKKLKYTFNRETVFIGTTDARERVLVTVSLYRQPVDREVQTVEHGTVVNPENLSVIVAAFTGKKNIDRNLANGLHSIEYFGPKVTQPGPGYTIDEVRELVALLTRWKGNVILPGCAHMTQPEGNTSSEKMDAEVTCPKTGQKWGHAWYADPLPDEVRARIIELIEKGQQEEANY